MSAFLQQFKWQFILLQKNNIVSISFIVTFIYGAILFIFKDVEMIDKVLVTLVLIDPTIIGYFFIALAFYTEKRSQILPAVFVTPVNFHHFLITKIISLSLLGTLCSLALVFSVKGLNFHFFTYTLGSFSICVLSTLLGLIVLPFATDFLKFALLSFPVFIVCINISQLQYLGVLDLGQIKYLFPMQGCIDLIDHGVSGKNINFLYAISSIVVLIPLGYYGAFQLFMKKIYRE